MSFDAEEEEEVSSSEEEEYSAAPPLPGSLVSGVRILCTCLQLTVDLQ